MENVLRSRSSSLAHAAVRRSRASYLPAGLAAGVTLALTALLVRRAAKRAETRHPAIGRFVVVDGVRLHYLEQGAGRPVVLLHGNGTQARDFFGSGLAGRLAQHYRVIAFDRPGFGYSQRPRAHLWTPGRQARLLQAAFGLLNIERPVVVGHSWGALVALALALRAPEAVRGLLLIGGYYYPSLRLDTVLLSGPALPLVGDVLRYTLSPLLGRLTAPLQIRQMFAPLPVPEAFRQEVPLDMMLRPWQLRAGAVESALMAPAAAALARHYSELQLPVTVAAGSDDRIVDYRAHSARLHQELPHSRLLVIHGRGHMLHYAEPEQLALAVDDLFAAHAPFGQPQPPVAHSALGTAGAVP